MSDTKPRNCYHCAMPHFGDRNICIECDRSIMQDEYSKVVDRLTAMTARAEKAEAQAVRDLHFEARARGIDIAVHNPMASNNPDTDLRVSTLRWALQRAVDHLISAQMSAAVDEVKKILIDNNMYGELPMTEPGDNTRHGRTDKKTDQT